MNVLDVENNNIIISSEALCMSFFKKIWDKDKDKNKINAGKDIKYVYFMCDPRKNLFFKYPTEKRSESIKQYVLEDLVYKPSKDVEAAIIEYKELIKSPILAAIEGAYSAIYNMKKKLEDIEIDPETSQKLIMNLPKMAGALAEAEKMLAEATSSSNRVRGNQTLGALESGEF